MTEHAMRTIWRGALAELRSHPSQGAAIGHLEIMRDTYTRSWLTPAQRQRSQCHDFPFLFRSTSLSLLAPDSGLDLAGGDWTGAAMLPAALGRQGRGERERVGRGVEPEVKGFRSEWGTKVGQVVSWLAGQAASWLARHLIG